MSRSDMPSSLSSQLLRPTTLGPAGDVDHNLIARAFAAWEIRRGIGVTCPIGRGSAEWRAVREQARERMAARFIAEDAASPEKHARDAARLEKKRRDNLRWAANRKAVLLKERIKYAEMVLSNPDAYPRLTVVRVRIEHARRTGGEAAVLRECELIQQERKARYRAKHKPRVPASTTQA